MADKKDILSNVVPIDDSKAEQDKAILESMTKPFDAAREKLISKAVDKLNSFPSCLRNYADQLYSILFLGEAVRHYRQIR